MTVEQIRKGTAKVLLSGEEWPPVLSEFIKICRFHDVDFDGLFDKFINRELASNQFERMIFRDATHANVRRKAIGEDRRAFNKIAERWATRRATGQMPQDVPALAAKSVVMPTDKLREARGIPNPSEFPKGSAMARIAQRVNQVKNIKSAKQDY